MKKFLSILMTAMLLMSLFAVSASAEAVEITMWIFPLGGDERAAEERAMYDSISAAFTEQNPDIKVNIEMVPWDNRETKMLTAFGAGQGPDCMYMNPDIMKLFQTYDVLLPLDEYVSEEHLAGFNQDLLKNGAMIDGKLYGLPCLVDIGVPLYNLDMMAKAGLTEEDIPTTWDEYDALLGKLKEAGMYGTYFNYSYGPVSDYSYAMFFSEGCDMVLEDGTVTVDDAAGMKVLNRIVSWYQKGYTPADSLSVFDDGPAFAEQRVATFLPAGGSGMLLRYTPNLTFNWAAGPVLSGDAGAYTMSTAASFSVSRNCKNPEAAVKWLEFFTNDENSAAWNNFAGYVSPRSNAVNTNADVKGFDIVLNSLGCVRGEVNHACARTMQSAYRPNLQAMAEGSVSVEDGVKQLKADIEKLIAELENAGK